MSASKDTESKTTSDLIKNWFLDSPSYGIRRIGRAKTLIARIFCGYIFWIFTVLMGCFIYIIIMNYVAHPTKFNLNLNQHRDPKHFPAVTFCNINPLKDDELLYDKRKHPLPRSESSSLTEDEYLKAFHAYIVRIREAKDDGQRYAFVELGFKLNDILITCVFNGRSCGRNLTQFFHPNYGNCYTFDNDKHLQSEINYARNYWSINDDNREDNYRLFLELFLLQNKYNQALENRAGFRIFIHQKNEIPILSQHSLLVGPNKFTTLRFLPRVVSFYQQCQKDLTKYMKEMFLTNQVRYTQALCYKLCKHRFIVQRCKCIDPLFLVFYRFFNNINNEETTTNISLCPIDNQCFSSHATFNSSEFCPECLTECEIIQYSTQSSYAYYPNVNAKDRVLQRVRNHFRFDEMVNADLNLSDGSSSNRHANLRNNIVGVEISASPYATEILTESPVYTWVDLISSIGGQTGLWIGVSLISFVEIIELLYLLINRI